MRTGQCHCGAIRYAVEGEPMHHTLCHCTDCRRHSGAPFVGWAMFKSEQVGVTQGEAKVYASSETGRRHFCGDCGTGLFYTNHVVLPGITDIQSVTLDAPESLPPSAHIQVADRIPWMTQAHNLPEFERFPGG
jgi:hypothetical protein